MITVDLHSHTYYSHAVNSPLEMYNRAKEAGIKLLGFSEHSPRPEPYNYKHEYREHLKSNLQNYIDDITFLKNQALKEDASCQVLLGMEFDWLEGAELAVKEACFAFDFDYRIGSVHFLGTWGFDENPADWQNLSQDECEQHYQNYFEIWHQMLASGLFQIAAHPDLIKIFSIEKFKLWLEKTETQNLIYTALQELAKQNMAMEISSAGLRKPCHEIYPNPIIMQMAKDLNIPISFASDAHNLEQINFGFQEIADYAKNFGYQFSLSFNQGKVQKHLF